MKMAVGRGHQYTGEDGASQGLVKEIDVAEKYYKLVIEGLRSQGHEVLDVTPPEANRTLSNSLNYRVEKANNWGADLFVSCHVNNAYDEKYNGTMGCEVLYHRNSSKGKEYAEKVNSELLNLGFVKHQGAYADTRGLAEMNNTNMPAIIIEPFFVEATEDVAIYNRVGDTALANAIIKGITGQEVQKGETSGVNSKIEEATQNCYVLSEYLPTGYLGQPNTDFQGIDVEYIRTYLIGVRWEVRHNTFGQWIVTELLDPKTAKNIRNSLGSWFCEFRTSNK